jgi:hypothetical protein
MYAWNVCWERQLRVGSGETEETYCIVNNPLYWNKNS